MGSNAGITISLSLDTVAAYKLPESKLELTVIATP